MPINFSKLNYTRQTGTTSATANEATPVKNRIPSEYDGATNWVTLLSGEGVYLEGADPMRTGTNFPATEVQFEAGTMTYYDAINLSPNVWVVAFDDGGDSNKGKAVVITKSGTTLTAWTADVFNDATTTCISLCRLSDTTFVVAYCDDGGSDYLCARIGTVTVSTGDVAWGTEKEVVAAAIDKTTSNTAVCEPRSGVVAFAYQLAGDSKGYLIACDYTTTTFGTAGSAVEFEAHETLYISMDAIAVGRVVIGFHDANDTYLKTVVGTVSAAKVCVAGTAEAHSGASASSVEVHKASENRGILSWIDTGDYHMFAFDIGTSGTTLNEGADATATGTVLTVSSTLFNDTQGVLAYEDDAHAGDYGKVMPFTITWAAMESGGTVAFGTEDTFAEAITTKVTVAGNIENEVVIFFDDGGASNVSKCTYGAYVDDIIDVRSTAASAAYVNYILPIFERTRT